MSLARKVKRVRLNEIQLVFITLLVDFSRLQRNGKAKLWIKKETPFSGKL
jgi:hypothetical protein